MVVNLTYTALFCARNFNKIHSALACLPCLVPSKQIETDDHVTFLLEVLVLQLCNQVQSFLLNIIEKVIEIIDINEQSLLQTDNARRNLIRLLVDEGFNSDSSLLHTLLYSRVGEQVKHIVV